MKTTRKVLEGAAGFTAERRCILPPEGDRGEFASSFLLDNTPVIFSLVIFSVVTDKEKRLGTIKVLF